MAEHLPHPHTPEQERLLSNHWVEGGIITAGGALLLRDAISDSDSYGEVPSKVLAGAGALLSFGLVAGSFHHGGPVTFFRADHQQREHLKMAALLTTGSLAPRFGRFGRLLSGAGIARIGQMFLTTSNTARAGRRRGQGANTSGSARRSLSPPPLIRPAIWSKTAGSAVSGRCS